jgi:hypothetical protein
MSDLTSYEKETIINYNNEEHTAQVFTYHRALQNKLNKLIDTNPDISVLRQGDEWTEYIVPKTWIKVSPLRQVNYTDEQRAAMAERLAAARNKEA